MIEQTLFTALSTASAITYQLVASATTPSLETSTGLTRTRMQFDTWGASYSDAVNLRQTILDTLLDAQIHGIQNILHLSSTDYFDHEALQFIARIEFYVFHA